MREEKPVLAYNAKHRKKVASLPLVPIFTLAWHGQVLNLRPQTHKTDARPLELSGPVIISFINQ